VKAFSIFCYDDIYFLENADADILLGIESDLQSMLAMCISDNSLSALKV